MKEIMATNLNLEELKLTQQNHISALNSTIDVVRKNGEGAASRVRDWEEFSATLATKEYAYSTANTLAKEAAVDGEVKEQVEHLMKYRDEYRERLCQAMRQMQLNRQELNNQADEIHQLRQQKGTLHRATEDLKQRVEELQGKEMEDSEGLRGVIATQRHNIADLEASVKKLQEDFRSHIDAQRGEAERLMERSNKTYLEQIDKALQLEKKVTNLERNSSKPCLQALAHRNQ
jgi:chromosome segregation ATPase